MKAQGHGCDGGRLGSCLHVVALCVVTVAEMAALVRLHYRSKCYCDQPFAHINDRKVS